MATFTFNVKQMQEYQGSLYHSKKIWFIPTHHGGCLQILGENEKIIKEIFCTRRTGYGKFCDDTCMIMSALQLKPTMLTMLEMAKTAKFAVKLLKGTKQIQHILTAQISKELAAISKSRSNNGNYDFRKKR